MRSKVSGLALACLLVAGAGTSSSATSSSLEVSAGAVPLVDLLSATGAVTWPGQTASQRNVFGEKVRVTGQLKVDDQARCANVKAGAIAAPAASALDVSVRRIVPPSGKLSVSGSLRVTGSVKYTTPANDLPVSPFSFAETSEVDTSLPAHWRRISHQTFASAADVSGWTQSVDGAPSATPLAVAPCAMSQSMVLRVACSAMLNRFSSGAEPHVSETRAQHRWQDLPVHKEVRVRATIHFIDSWRGSVAMLRTGSELLWTESPPAASPSALTVDMCGLRTEGDSGINKVVDVVFPHAGDA